MAQDNSYVPEPGNRNMCKLPLVRRHSSKAEDRKKTEKALRAIRNGSKRTLIEAF